jgi:hypothetical protein
MRAVDGSSLTAGTALRLLGPKRRREPTRLSVERLIGSVRRECLGQVIIYSEDPLRRGLTDYFDYYNRSRTHLSLDNNSPIPRETEPPEAGEVVAIPQVGGLDHRYTHVA